MLQVKQGSNEEQFHETIINKSNEACTIKTQDSNFSFEQSLQSPKEIPIPLKGELSEEQEKILEEALKVYGRVSNDSKLQWLSRLVKVDIQSVTDWFETRKPSRARTSFVTKVKKLDVKKKRANKKANVKHEVEKEVPLKKLVKNSPKKAKIRDASIQPRAIWKEKIHVQKSQCLNPMYSNFEKCRSCIHKNGDVCRFRDFRVFQETSKDYLVYGPAFQSSTNINKPLARNGRNKEFPQTSIPKELLMLGSRLSLPPEIGVEHENYLRKIIAPSLMTIINREIQFMRDKVYYQRATSMGVRQMCDVCLTSIFNGFWLCCVCGMEVCLYCYDEWTTRVGMCSYKRTHDKSQMIRVSRVSLQELERLQSELLPDATSTDTSSNLEESIKKGLSCEADYLCEDYENVNLKDFQEKWRRGETVVIRNLLPKVKLDWSPSYFRKHHGNEKADMVDCSTGCTVANMTVDDFFRGFSDVSLRPVNKEENHLIMRIKVSIANVYPALTHQPSPKSDILGLAVRHGF
ncbi:hypothetical protein K7432_000386 [Basidiobolus ranarum]|uniref:Homeobox domain-containing protein n=1 Tax=Basidiobolus ranarum TaxID=34480 RepID=A0ABR2WBB4_9FUNG